MPITAPTSKPIGPTKANSGSITRVSSVVNMIEPVCRSPWISAWRGGQELVFARLRRDLERRVGLEGALVGVELRAGPAVERRLAIGIGEDQVLGDPAELDIAREQLEPALVLGRGAGEHRGVKQRRGEKFGDVGGEARVLDARGPDPCA